MINPNRLYHGTNADFEPYEFRIGMSSTTIPIGGGAAVRVRNSAAFFTPDPAIAHFYGRRVLVADLPAEVRILNAPEFDWRWFENDLVNTLKLRKQGYGAVRFHEGDAGYETIAVLDPSLVVWRDDACSATHSLAP